MGRAGRAFLKMASSSRVRHRPWGLQVSFTVGQIIDEQFKV